MNLWYEYDNVDKDAIETPRNFDNTCDFAIDTIDAFELVTDMISNSYCEKFIIFVYFSNCITFADTSIAIDGYPSDIDSFDGEFTIDVDNLDGDKFIDVVSKMDNGNINNAKFIFTDVDVTFLTRDDIVISDSSVTEDLLFNSED